MWARPVSRPGPGFRHRVGGGLPAGDRAEHIQRDADAVDRRGFVPQDPADPRRARCGGTGHQRRPACLRAAGPGQWHRAAEHVPRAAALFPGALDGGEPGRLFPGPQGTLCDPAFLHAEGHLWRLAGARHRRLSDRLRQHGAVLPYRRCRVGAGHFRGVCRATDARRGYRLAGRPARRRIGLPRAGSFHRPARGKRVIAGIRDSDLASMAQHIAEIEQ